MGSRWTWSEGLTRMIKHWVGRLVMDSLVPNEQDEVGIKVINTTHNDYNVEWKEK